MPEDQDAIIQYLVDMGIIVPLGITEEDGEDLYRITEKAGEIFPEIVEEQQRYINEAVFDLWNLELIDVVFNEDGEPLVGLNENSLDREKLEAIENEELKRSMFGILITFADKFGNTP